MGEESERNKKLGFIIFSILALALDYQLVTYFPLMDDKLINYLLSIFLGPIYFVIYLFK